MRQESMPRGKVTFNLFTPTPGVCWTLFSSVVSLLGMLFLLGRVLGILDVCLWTSAGAAGDCPGEGQVSMFSGKVTLTFLTSTTKNVMDTLSIGWFLVAMAGESI